MKHNYLIYSLVIATCISTTLTAREFRTPIPLLRYWLHTEPLNPLCEQAQFYAWAGYYQRKCDTALNVETTDTHKSPLSALLFNRADFPVNDIFATQTTSPINILFSTLLSPRYTYTDRGVVLGLVSSHAVRCNVVVGGRVTIPFRNFNMRLTQGPIVNNQIDPAILDANVREQVEFLGTNSTPVETFAYRLQFLHQLPESWSPPGLMVRLVDYVDTGFKGNPPANPVTYPITIANVDVTNNFNTLNQIRQNPVTVFKPPLGTAPTPPFAQPIDQAQSFDGLPGSGSPVPIGGRARFLITTPYGELGANTPEQEEIREQLWIEPTFISTPTVTKLVDPACIIKKRVDLLIGSPATQINAFFERAGINFNSRSHGGLGDIDAQFFTQYWWNQCSFVEGNVALRLPTAGAQVAPGLIALQSLGNNGHPEIMIGTRTYWHDYDWLLLQADALFSVVLKRAENVALPLQGATIKNIGSGVPANVNWHYFLGHAEASIARPITCKDYALMRFGYELYIKSRDSISLQSNACTCIPTGTNLLNANNLRINTDVTTHKLYGEICLRHEFDCITAGIFASVGGVVGGKNTPQDTDWYIGLEFFL
ncbi:MAG: hypothetical protein AB7F19_04795 [Candidatus Babeliales bacterium]